MLVRRLNEAGAAATKCCDYAKISFEEQITLAYQADVVMGIHGAALTHAVFGPRGKYFYLPNALSKRPFTQISPFLVTSSSRRCVHPGAEDHVWIWIHGVLPHIGLQVTCFLTHTDNALYQRALSTPTLTITHLLNPPSSKPLTFLERVFTAK